MRNRLTIGVMVLGLLLVGPAALAARVEDDLDGGAVGGSDAQSGRTSLNRTTDGLVAVGQPAPEFTLPDAAGRAVSLKTFRGRPLVLYFYPMDDSPGCIKEACAFRDDRARYDSLGVRVVGVSTDDPASHRAFAAKHELPFTLLADTTGTVVQLYGTGAAVEQEGSKRWIAKRVTYLIDAEGVIRQVWPRVNPVGHSDQILAAWEQLAPRKVR